MTDKIIKPPHFHVHGAYEITLIETPDLPAESIKLIELANTSTALEYSSKSDPHIQDWINAKVQEPEFKSGLAQALSVLNIEAVEDEVVSAQIMHVDRETKTFQVQFKQDRRL